jgi:AcrR family transcriptional regulator
MNTASKEKPRERIIDIASKLFYTHGINSVGVDMVCVEADVSKRTLYKYYPSKEILVSTAIEKLGLSWFKACTEVESSDPTERITHIFKMVEPMAEAKDFYGCILMNTSIELRSNDDLAMNVARDFKNKLYEYFKEQATLLEIREPDVLAEQLVMLYDGCSAWIVMRRTFPTSTFQTLNMMLKSRD